VNIRIWELEDDKIIRSTTDDQEIDKYFVAANNIDPTNRDHIQPMLDEQHLKEYVGEHEVIMGAIFTTQEKVRSGEYTDRIASKPMLTTQVDPYKNQNILLRIRFLFNGRFLVNNSQARLHLNLDKFNKIQGFDVAVKENNIDENLLLLYSIPKRTIIVTFVDSARDVDCVNAKGTEKGKAYSLTYEKGIDNFRDKDKQNQECDSMLFSSQSQSKEEN